MMRGGPAAVRAQLGLTRDCRDPGLGDRGNTWLGTTFSLTNVIRRHVVVLAATAGAS
jgi:hypothetical protein